MDQKSSSFRQHRRTIALKRIADVVTSNIDKHSVEGETAVNLCNYIDVYRNEFIVQDLDFMEATASTEQIRNLSLKPGDVLITKDSETPDDIAVPAVVRDHVEGLVCGYHLARIRPRADAVDGRFLMRFFEAASTRAYFAVRADGITRFGLTQYDIKNVPLNIPLLSQQKIIADFLDRETASADALVAKYERLIELLEEKRVALITQAVTKGLDPNVPMKDSGIEWIGDIPATWEALPIRRVATSVQTGGTPPDALFSEYGLPWYTPACFGLEISISSAEKYVTKEDALENGVRIFPACSVLVVGIGTLGKVGYSETECTGNQQLNAIITNDRTAAKYLAYVLYAYSDVLKALSSAATLPILNQSKMKEVVMPHPDAESQQEIIRFLDETASATRGLVSNAMRAIELIKERRSALITAAVTGQIDVHADNPGQVEATA